MKNYIAFLILLLSSGLRFVGTIPLRTKILTNNSSTQTQYYLSSYIIPQHYNISLNLLTKNKYINNFYGRVNITINVHVLTQNISLHVEPYVKIRKCILSTKDKPEEIYKPKPQIYYDTQKILVLHFEKEVFPNIYILQIRFKGIYDEGGFLISPHVNKTRYEAWSAATYFQSINSRIFPCLDEPAMKATFSITVKHHSNITALSNMPIKKTTILRKNNMKRTTFLPTNAIPAYLVGVVLADVEFIDNNNTSKILNVWYGKQYLAKDIKFAQKIAETVSLYTEIKWTKYPRIAKVDHIVIPGLHDNSAQYLGLATYREADIIFNEELTPMAQKVKITRTVSRTMAQQWLNNLVRLDWWSNLWLNDGLATLLGMYAVDKILPESEMLDLFVVQYRHESLHLDSYFMEPLISELNVPSKINSLAAFSRYIKAPVILHMLRYVVTDHVFWKGFRMYFEYQVNPVNPKHFWKSVHTALIEGRPENKFNVKLVMDAWTKQTHYPVLNAELDENNLKLTVLLQNVSNYKNWWIPVTYATETSPNFKRSFDCHGKWLKNIPSSSRYCNFTLNKKENGWVIVNLKQTGYYRVNYDYSNWLRITKSLNNKYKYTQIHALNRAQLIDDSFYFMVAGQLNSSVFWTIATYLKQESNYIAWYPMFKIFEYMSSVLPLQEIKVQEIKKQVCLILDELLKKIGYNEYPYEKDFSKSLKQEAVKWACIFGVPECKIWVKHTLEQHLGYPVYHKLLPWWKEWTYCKGMMAKSEDDLTLNEILTMLQNNTETKLFEFMSCYGSPKVTSIFLETLVKKPNILIGVQTMMLINNYLLTISKHVRNEEIFQDIITHFETTKPKEVSTIVALINIINHVYSKHQLAQIIEFVKNNAKQQLSYTEQKIKIRWSQIEYQKSYLTKF